ncbi:MAG: glycosyltransferase [Pseudomonadota bacterium]|nr:glycosyltransferase [Pseudomonadota bacterium]
MARVIVSHFSGIHHSSQWHSSCFYDGLVQSLAEQGNDVLHILSSDFIKRPWNGNNQLLNGIDGKLTLERIRSFNPDLVIAFNNSTIEGMEDAVDCPFILWDADSLAYFNNKEEVQKKKDRYIFLAFSTFGAEEYRQVLSPSLSRVHRVQAATAIKAEKKKIRDNISFIGTYFILNYWIQCAAGAKPENTAALIKEFEKGPDFNLDRALEENDLEDFQITEGALRGLRAGENRNQTIAAVAPLGIQIFGTQEWYSAIHFSINTFLSYDPRFAYSLAHNQDIYNRSRIGINISHSQNITGYPWRVMDILASSACLVSDRKTDLEKDFGEKIPLQFYETPWEAYSVCRKLLENEALRQDVVSASNAAIEAGFRWKHRFRDIEQICGTKLLNPDREGSVSRLMPDYGGAYRIPESALKLMLWAMKKTPSSLRNSIFRIAKGTGMGKYLDQHTKQILYHLMNLQDRHLYSMDE